MPQLVIESGSEIGKAFGLQKPMVSIGRSVSNTIQIIDRKMSRNHAEIHFRRDGQLLLKDLGSRNGTLLNGKAVREPVSLHHNDRIQFGDTVLRVEIAEHEIEKDDTTGQLGLSEKTVVAGNFVVVEEKQWGATRSQRRAGYDPESSRGLEATSNLDLRQPHRRLEILYQITEAIRSVFSLDELLDRIMSIIQIVMRPDRTYLLLRENQESQAVPVVVKVRDGQTPVEIKISMSIVNRCMNDRVSLLVSDASMDERFNDSESILQAEIRTAMVSPLIFKDQCIGVIYIDNFSKLVGFTEEDLDLLTSIANQAAVAITNARLQNQILEQHKIAREMEIARTIQMNLLPKVYPEISGYQVSAMSLPAKQVGGDYYDFLALPDGRTGFAVADVSGKGVPAAILTATIRSYIQSETQFLDIPLTECVARINRMVCRDVTNDMYVTLFMAALERESGAIEFVNAGHCHPLIIHSDGTTEALDDGGIFLGIDDELTFALGRTVLPPGGLLVLFTDGVTDIQNPVGELFGHEAFVDLLRAKRRQTAEEIRNAVYQSCIRHRGTAEQFDDFTLIVIKRYEPSDSELD